MTTRVLVAVGLVVCVLAAPAQAGELVTIDVPSDGNVDAADVRWNGADHPRTLKANVLLPDGYRPDQPYPVLYLLHGVGDRWSSWVDRGAAREILAGLPAIVVMPEADRGFYANWWNGGRRGRPAWERYYLEELIPHIERRYRIREGRRWHAVVGFSMGGFGATLLGSRLPDYFGSVATFSGFLSVRRPELDAGFEAFAGVPYTTIFGPRTGFYAEGHDPVALAGNLRQSRVFVTVGDGIASKGLGSGVGSVVLGGIAEAELRQQAEDFVAAARANGADLTYRPQSGVHDWPYWQDNLRDVLRWGLFEDVAESPPGWEYRTVSERGRAWGLRFAFRDPPPSVSTIRRAGDTYAAEGEGALEICGRDGLGFSRELPFSGARLGRAVDVAIRRQRGRTIARTRRLRMRARSSELLTVTYTARLLRTGRDRLLARRVLRMFPGRNRPFSFELEPVQSRRFRRLRRPRVRVTAQYGRCDPRRSSQATRTIRR